MMQQCAESRVYDRSMRFPKPHPCPRKGTVERDGKWWCKQHDPEAVRQRNTESRERFEAGCKKMRQGWDDGKVGAWLRENDKTRYEGILKAAEETK